MEKLVIVESPSKSKTIKQYLGNDYQVLSSKGHIRDLSISNVGGLGLDIENDFKPSYSTLKDKQKIIQELQTQAKKAKEIYLATDPDREGEAISWHLKEVLEPKAKGSTFHRVIFNEVTKSAVTQAFEDCRDLDLNLVSSQETRRILDRIIGFKLSKLLQNKIKSKSAGRVQSAALKIIVDKEREIEAFVKEEYWKIKATFEDFEADLSRINNKKTQLSSESEAQKVLDKLSRYFLVKSIKKRQRKKQAKPPFTTSSLQQEASNRLNFTAQKTMMIAQKLYEGITLKDETVGLITYMRTDSTRLSQSFIKPTQAFIEKQFGKDYVGRMRKHQSKKNTQDAHEAIRPTHTQYHPDKIKPYLSTDEYKLYKMIYARSLATLMAPALLENTTLRLENQMTIFTAKAQALNFDGYLKVYSPYESTKVTTLPTLEEGQKIESNAIEKSQHFTQPPARYTEATLIKEMEDLGIGRPSTYSQTVDTLKKRRYVSLQEKKFHPTEQGRLTIEKLEDYFKRIISVDYTAKMENILDDIAQAEADQTEVVKAFYHNFMPLVEKANQEMEKLAPKTTGEDCPKCGSPMVYRQSRYGTFEACSAYPKCKYIKPEEGQKETEKTDITCPKCKKGKIVERIAKRGKNKGNTFYACDNFPKCKNILRGKPTGETCEEGNDLMVELPDGKIVCNGE